MAFQLGSWRFLALPTLLACLALGCGGGNKKSSSEEEKVTLSGTVSFMKQPLLKDANGVPTGLDSTVANFTKQVSVGITVRALKAEEETQADGTKTTVWTLAGSGVTDSNGKYSFSLAKGGTYCVEVLGSWTGSSATVKLVADPAGLASSTLLLERAQYALRKAPDGSTPAGVTLPASVLNAKTTLDFEVTKDTSWWICPPGTTRASEAVLESSPTGSRVLAILHSLQAFSSLYGDPGLGATLNLHYRPGVSDTRGTFVEYDKNAYPMAYTALGFQYVGAIRGAVDNDDAWDEAVLYTLWGRNAQVTQGYAELPPFRARGWASPEVGSDQVDLSPDLALVMGLPELMAANLLKSPYLADLNAGAPVVHDVRSLGSLPKDIHSAPAMAKLGWELLRYANGTLSGSTLTPLEDTPTGWAKIDPKAFLRFFPCVAKSLSASTTDLITIYDLLDRLQDSQANGEPVNLKDIFTDAHLKLLTDEYGITWPRPTGTSTLVFRTAWGVDPSGAMAPFTLGMAKAHALEDGSYPNASKGEVFRAQFTLKADPDYYVDVTPLPPAGSKIEVKIGKETLTFDASTPADPWDLSKNIKSLVGNADKPPTVLVRVRLLSPSALVADQAVTLTLRKAPHA